MCVCVCSATKRIKNKIGRYPKRLAFLYLDEIGDMVLGELLQEYGNNVSFVLYWSEIFVSKDVILFLEIKNGYLYGCKMLVC